MDGRLVMLFFLAVMLVYVIWHGASNQDADISIAANDPKHGQELFDKNCAECHAAKEGIPVKAPALGFYGQEYRLTDRELVATAKQQGEHKLDSIDENNMSTEEIQELVRMRETMKNITAKLSNQEVRDIIAFLKTSWSADAKVEHWIATHQPPGQ